MSRTHKSPADHLNPEQRQAVEHGVTGQGSNVGPPVAVIAGAGSGKTKVLAERIANLVAKGVEPSRILAITFTRKAADQIKGRVRSALAANGRGAWPGIRTDLPWAGTFHSVGTRLIHIHATHLGLKPGFTTLDRDDSVGLIDIVRRDCGLAERELEFPKATTCLDIYSRTVNAQKKLGSVMREHFPWCTEHKAALRKLFAAYVDAKRGQCVLDFDDLLLHWHDLLHDPALAKDIGDRFDHILVDEFQDTNTLQASILRLMKPDGAGMFIVGDEAQSIYSFRAAEVRNILDFPGSFTPPARIIKLERNYRSTQPILDASNAVINVSEQGFGKNLTANRKGGDKPRLVTVGDGTEEAAFVADEIEDRVERGRSLKGIAVLVRAARHSAMLELELARRGIAFKKFGGTKFTEAAHVKDLIAIIRWAENPGDMIAGMRVLNLLPGIGQKTARDLIDSLVADDFAGGLKRFSSPRRARKAWPPFVALMRRVHGDKLGWPAEVDAVRQWLTPMLQGLYDDPVERGKDLEQLQAMAGTFKTRRRFLTDLALDPPSKGERAAQVPKGEDEDFVTISTIHSAKGLEWRAVYVLNVTEGGLPSSRATKEAEIEEERRLLYVAMTRAERALTLMVPMNKTAFGGNHQISDTTVSRTRFLPEGIVGVFDAIAWRSNGGEGDDAVASDARGGGDLAARIRHRWLDA